MMSMTEYAECKVCHRKRVISGRPQGNVQYSFYLPLIHSVCNTGKKKKQKKHAKQTLIIQFGIQKDLNELFKDKLTPNYTTDYS